MRTNRDEFLNRLFAMYRELLGDFEPSPAFTARVWAAIASRREENPNPTWLAYLIAWSPRLAVAALVLAALTVVSQWAMLKSASSSVVLDSSYEDVLIQSAMDQSDGAIWVLAENGE